MELTMKGRGLRLTDQDRRAAAKKLARLERKEPRAVRVELEVIAEKNPRLDGAKRVEASLSIPRKTFRAHADGPDVEAAIDRVSSKLERQLRDHHEKRKARTTRSSNRLDSTEQA